MNTVYYEGYKYTPRAAEGLLRRATHERTPVLPGGTGAGAKRPEKAKAVHPLEVADSIGEKKKGSLRKQNSAARPAEHCGRAANAVPARQMQAGRLYLNEGRAMQPRRSAKARAGRQKGEKLSGRHSSGNSGGNQQYRPRQT